MLWTEVFRFMDDIKESVRVAAVSIKMTDSSLSSGTKSDKAVKAGLSDRNPTVRINYAGCIRHLVRTARDSTREKLFAKLKTWYMEKEDEASRAAVAFTYQAVTRHNPDVMKAFAASALPISFLAMHQEKTAASSDILEVWEEVWLEGTPGTEAGIRLYLPEIMELFDNWNILNLN